MTRYGLSLVAVAFVAAAASAQQPAPGGGGGPFVKALTIAQNQVPGGVLVKGRTESNTNGMVFGFYFWVNGNLREIEIGGDGKIVKDTDKKNDPVSQDVANLIMAKGQARAKLPDGRLMEIAGAALRGAPVTNLRYIREGDRLLVRVGDVTIDAETGQVVSTPQPK